MSLRARTDALIAAVDIRRTTTIKGDVRALAAKVGVPFNGVATTLAALEAEHGARRFACDAADPDGVTKLFDEVEAALGVPTLVVHNIDGRMADIFRKPITEADPVLVRQGAILAAGFHPELVAGHPVTALFADMVRGRVRDTGTAAFAGI